MGEIIRSWLQSRLGVIIDLTPEVFGHYSRDGTLLAKLLYNYDIINDTQLETIIQTKDPSLARVNLKHLRAWLKFIGVDLDDNSIEDISNGKGTASLRVFYKLFLCLETKDRLHFITLQKERERNIASSAKFNVKIISEKPPPAEPSDHPLSAPLVTSADVIEWHRKKFLKLIDRHKHQESSEEVLNHSEHFLETKNLGNLKRKKIVDEENIELDDFTHKNSIKCMKLHDEHVNNDPNAAKKYIKSLQHRKNRAIAAENSKNQTQRDVLSSIWGKIERDQDRKLDEMIAKKVLKESHYEKQMLTKLCEIRKDKDRISDNRRLVEGLMQKAKEESFRLDEERNREELRREVERIEDENRRLKELKCRIDNKKLEKAQEYLKNLGRQLMNDLMNLSVDSAEYKIVNHQQIPRKVWNYWKALFIQGLSALDPEEILHPIEMLQRGEGEEIITANSELIKREEFLDKKDLDDYLKLNVPWNEFIPEIDKESKCFLELGRKILGYIVHRLLGLLYPSNSNSLPPLPDYPVRTALLGLPDSSLHSDLQEFLSSEGLETVQVMDTINFCLQRYKQEIKEFEFVNLEGNDEDKFAKTSDTDKNENKNTETPKSIPFEDMHPLLSDSAFIGKCIYELLTHGKKISEELIAKALVAYLKSVTDIRGWVVIDYPGTYQQLITLESVLSGRQQNHDSYHSADDMTEEDFTEEFDRPFTSSRIVDNPLIENNSKINSQLTSFIRMKGIDDSGDGTDVDRFYNDQGLLSVFQYTSWNLETLEELCSLIINNERGKTESSGVPEINEENETKSLESFESLKNKSKSIERELQPGEPGWTYADTPQDKILLEELALHWINLESSYLNGLTEILSLKRFTFLAVLPYKDFMMKYMFEFLAQPDDRQELLRDFQKAFNDVSEDVRSDVEVKCELHCRVKDFQTQLWEICDQKRRECRKKREDVLRDHWTSGQMVILVNVYLAIMQIELNRFVDTISIIEGYYSSIMRKSIQGNRMAKPILHRVSFLEESIEDDKKIVDSKKLIKSPPLSSFNQLALQNEIEKILVSKNEESLELTNTNGFKIIKANIEYCKSFVDDSLSSASELLKKDDKKSKENPKKKGERKLSKRTSKVQSKREDSDDKNHLVDGKKSESVLKEWRYVLMYEITRMKNLLKILESAWKSDVEFLLTNIQHGFYLIEEKINETYKNELESIKEMARIFCLAIEHHKSISGKMIFDGDRFRIKFDPLKDEDSFRSLNFFPVEESDHLLFKMVQLGRLNDIFKKVAPSGIIPQLSFVFILQDLISCGEEDDKEPVVPLSWLELDPPDVFELVHSIFGNISHIEWREFLVYGMNIEHPTLDQLLDTLEHFRRKDEALSGILPKSVFVNIPLWFHESLISPSINSWLHEDFEYDEYEYSNRSSEDYDNSRTNSVRIKSKKKTISFRTDSIEKKFLGIDEVTSEDVRLNLAKELLCEVFVENTGDVNYLKLLLSFCKDEDPKNGLGKALSVTLNCRVCSDFEEGEKFVEESFRMKENYDIFKEEIAKEAEELVDKIIIRIFDNSEKSVILNADNVPIITDEIQIQRSGRISIEILDRPGEILDPTSLIEVDTDKSSSDSRTSSSGESDGSSFSQNMNSENSLGNDGIKRETYYWIPISILENFLMNLIPNLNEKISEFSSKTLIQNLKMIHDETKCQELNENPEMVLAHRVINHKFISLLLDKIPKFTWKNMGKAVEVILQKKPKEKVLK